jgi:hypothetical protein
MNLSFHGLQQAPGRIDRLHGQEYDVMRTEILNPALMLALDFIYH